MHDIDNSVDVLDIRDLINRIEELRADRANLSDEVEEAQTDMTFASHGDGDTTGELTERLNVATAALAAWNAGDEAEELRTLESFVEEMKDYGGDHQWEGDWYPVTLVRDSYWDDYAREFAEDIHGDKMREASWPFDCIDWEKAGRELQMDYSSAEYDGVTYWYR